MRYTVTRVPLAPALRMAFVLGWVVAAVPALLGGALVMAALEALDRQLSALTPLELSVLGQRVARLDWLTLFGLTSLASTVHAVVALGWLAFAAVSLALTASGALVLAFAAGLGVVAYNAIARRAGGVQLELRPASPAAAPPVSGRF